MCFTWAKSVCHSLDDLLDIWFSSSKQGAPFGYTHEVEGIHEVVPLTVVSFNCQLNNSMRWRCSLG